jgi:methylase of polypeptide subunit release factors
MLFDLAPVLALPPETLHGLAPRLRKLGLTRASLQPMNAPLHGIHPLMRSALRLFHLKQSPDPAALAARLWMFGDSITAAEAEAILGDLLAPLVGQGLLAKTDGRVSSRLVLGLVDDLYLFADVRSHGEDAVLSPGDGTVALISAAYPGKSIDRMLDLGCGSGTCALVLAKRARQVIATDIYARALELTRLNAVINGITNVEVREGSLFEPVAGETFDLIVSQPPFIPKPEDAEVSTFLYGGSRGDELPLMLLSGLAPHLREAGRAVLLVEWPVGAEGVAARVRRALKTDEVDLLILEAPSVSADEHAVEYAASVHPRLDDAFASDAIMRRDHCYREGIAAIQPAFVIIERPSARQADAAGRTGWTNTVAITTRARGKVTAARIDKLVAAHAISIDPRKLLAARVRLPEGTRLVEEQAGPGVDKQSSLSAQFADEALVPPVQLTPALLALITLLHEADTVADGLQRFADTYDVPPEEARRLLIQVGQRLRQGVLEIA